MADAVAAPAPAATAPAAASPASADTVAAPAADAPAAKPEAPKKGKARHAEIRAKLSAAKAPAATDAKPEAGTAVPPSKDAAPAAKKDEPADKPKPAVGAVMRLTAENTKLKGQVEELQTAAKKYDGVETIESIRAKVKADPAIIFDLFGDDIDADAEKRWERLVDSVRDRNDPAAKAESEKDRRISALEKEREESKATEAARAEEQRAARRRENTAKMLTEGFKAENGELVIDPAKYPYTNHLTKVGEIDAHAGIASTVRDMVVEFQKSKDRIPSDGEIAQMHVIAADEAEKYFSKRAKNWTLEQPKPAEPTPAVETKRTPTTIGSGIGGRGAAGVDASKLSKRERHALISERLRQASRQAAN